MHLINNSNNIEIFTDENITYTIQGEGRGGEGVSAAVPVPAKAAKVSQGCLRPWSAATPLLPLPTPLGWPVFQLFWIRFDFRAVSDAFLDADHEYDNKNEKFSKNLPARSVWKFWRWPIFDNFNFWYRHSGYSGAKLDIIWKPTLLPIHWHHLFLFNSTESLRI